MFSRNLFLFLSLFVLVGQASAEVFYVEQVKQVEVSNQELQKALKQIEEHKDIEVLDSLFVQPFHKRAQLKESAKKPLCLNCHLPLPHRESERSRTFMNMHSQFIACETCHMQDKESELEYHWLAYDGTNAGNMVEPVNRIIEDGKEKVIPSLQPEDGARIAPFYKSSVAVVFDDAHFSDQVKRAWKSGSDPEKAELKTKLHQPLEKKGLACHRCHTEKDNLLDLTKLGATEEQQRAIETNVLARFFKRYKKEDERLRIRELLR